MARELAVSAFKLATKLGDADLAAKLVRAGYTNPQEIRSATDRQLRAIPSIGVATLEQIRAIFPYRG